MKWRCDHRSCNGNRFKLSSINWPAHKMWVFIAQFVEHCSANAEGMGSSPVEALKIFSRAKICSCLNWLRLQLRGSHLHFIYIPAVQSHFHSSKINICHSFQDAMGHAIGDWDNDGYLDWFSSAIWHNRTDCSVFGCKFESSGNVLFRNLGGRQFEEIAQQVIKTFFGLIMNRKSGRRLLQNSKRGHYIEYWGPL